MSDDLDDDLDGMDDSEVDDQDDVAGGSDDGDDGDDCSNAGDDYGAILTIVDCNLTQQMLTILALLRYNGYQQG